MISTNISDDEEDSCPETKQYCSPYYIETDSLKAADATAVVLAAEPQSAIAMFL